MRLTEQYRPTFIKRNENSRLYQAQMFRSCINSIKENAWVRDYGVDLERVRKLHFSTFAHSKVKGFMWLWCSHALPASTRLRGKDANIACPHCGEVEDIRHITYDCMVAAYIMSGTEVPTLSFSLIQNSKTKYKINKHFIQLKLQNSLVTLNFVRPISLSPNARPSSGSSVPLLPSTRFSHLA
jgi:hypothetical protein